MKSSDERIDEELRKALKERFDSFERLPDPALREKVFKELGDGSSMVKKGLIATLLLLISATAVVYFVSWSPERKEAIVAIANVSGSRSETAAAESHASANANGNGDGPGTQVAPLDAPTAENPAKVDSVLPYKKPVSMVSDRATPDVKILSRKKHRVTRAELIKAIREIGSSFGSLWIRDDLVSPEDRAFLVSELKKMGLVDDQPDSIAAGNATRTLEGPSMADQDIGVLDHRPLALPSYHGPADSLITPGKTGKRYEFLYKDRWNFVAGLTPLRTFQILTVRPGNGVIYQNFVLPTRISAETVGYKFSAGAERKGFQLLLNYGQFKQSYRYEIATSEFIVGPDLSGNYQVVRKGIPQKEKSTVRLVGLSLRKRTVLRSRFLRNYFGDVGAEWSRDLTSGRNMAWVNAGFGKELFAGNNTAMTIGPYFEYSLTKLRNPDNPFKIQPYQVGLSVGLRHTGFKVSAVTSRSSSQ
ncbi:hypothetical protein [Dyadobacter sp. 676]|uniref:Outer membrane protein beta-barrel domain-containing protein n=1 Tax=Dyadobacter sp. 676 TaxID=3088362 RepID=A0AAU8FK99_9BACT